MKIKNCLYCNKIFEDYYAKYCSRVCYTNSRCIPIEDRFWQKVDKTPGLGPNGDCWEWVGAKDRHGYGYIGFWVNSKKKSKPAYRIAFMLEYGINEYLPEYIEICHTCDNPPCVNPDHLFLGTHLENIKDCVNKDRQAKGENYHRSSLKNNDICSIVKNIEYRKYTRIQEARYHGVATQTIDQIYTNQIWRHIKFEEILIIGGSGYIGSALSLFLNSQDIKTENIDIIYNKDFNKLSTNFYKRFKSIILLAGLSSVAMCQDQQKTFKENVIAFFNFISKLNSDIKFIYASSASVYGNTAGEYAFENQPLNLPLSYYDQSKQIIDSLAYLSNLNYFGCRFATVNGPSPNIRVDTMINKMVLNAKNNGYIEIANKEKYRSILGINDLCRALLTILKYPKAEKGIYNLSSFDASINKIGSLVSNIMNVPLKEINVHSDYSFKLNTDKFKNHFNFEFKDTIESIVESLKNLNISEEEKFKYMRV